MMHLNRHSISQKRKSNPICNGLQPPVIYDSWQTDKSDDRQKEVKEISSEWTYCV
jgi:hypothetical protein